MLNFYSAKSLVSLYLIYFGNCLSWDKFKLLMPLGPCQRPGSLVPLSQSFFLGGRASRRAVNPLPATLSRAITLHLSSIPCVTHCPFLHTILYKAVRIADYLTAEQICSVLVEKSSDWASSGAAVRRCGLAQYSRPCPPPDPQPLQCSHIVLGQSCARNTHTQIKNNRTRETPNLSATHTLCFKLSGVVRNNQTHALFLENNLALIDLPQDMSNTSLQVV